MKYATGERLQQTVYLPFQPSPEPDQQLARRVNRRRGRQTTSRCCPILPDVSATTTAYKHQNQYTSNRDISVLCLSVRPLQAANSKTKGTKNPNWCERSLGQEWPARQYSARKVKDQGSPNVKNLQKMTSNIVRKCLLMWLAALQAHATALERRPPMSYLASYSALWNEI